MWFHMVYFCYKISIFLYTIAINIDLLYFKEYGNNYSFFLFWHLLCLVRISVRSTILSLSAVYCIRVCMCESVCLFVCVRVFRVWRFGFRRRWHSRKWVSFPKSIKGTFLKHTAAGRLVALI